MNPTRRDFIKFVVADAVTSGCPFNLELLGQSAEKRAIVDSEEHTICHQVRDLVAFDLPRVSAAHESGGLDWRFSPTRSRHADPAAD